MSLSADFNRDQSSGHPYRINVIQRIVNDFTASGTAVNTYAPEGSGNRVVIANLIISTDTACTATLSGNMSDPINFYFGHRGGVSMQLSPYVPIVGKVNEIFTVSCTFAGGVGNCSTVIFGYEEKKDCWV